MIRRPPRSTRTDTRFPYTTRFRSAWLDELKALGLGPAALPEPVVLYEGSAEIAAQRYPKNLNVAATLALAGTGMQDTIERVLADPLADRKSVGYGKRVGVRVDFGGLRHLHKHINT